MRYELPMDRDERRIRFYLRVAVVLLAAAVGALAWAVVLALTVS